MGWNEIFTLTCQGRPTGIFDKKVQMGGELEEKRSFLLYIFSSIWLLHMHVWQKKGFAVWIWILAVQMSLGPFWQISTVQGIDQVTIFFFLWLLLSNLNKLTQMAGFLALTPLNAQLDWPTKSRSELRELTVIMKSYEKEISVDARSWLTFLHEVLFIKRWTEFCVYLLLYSYVNSLIWIKNSLMTFKNLLTILLLMF